MGDERPLQIVGIGASAGGLEALEALVSRLTAPSAAFIVLQHLSPGHETALTDILSRRTALEVVTLQDGTRVEPSRIYVAPPTVDVALHQGVVRFLAAPLERKGPRPSIDAFFRSLADDQGEQAIGVVLSGAGTDGAQGLKAINEQGGLTFVQDPATAGHSGMPQSALDAGSADFCLGPAQIGDELTRLSSHRHGLARAAPVFDDGLRSKLLLLLRAAHGVDFGAYKHATLDRRIHRRMALHKLEHLADYLEYVQANRAELSALYADALITVTSFFRDREPFDALKSLVYPRLLEHRPPQQPLRVWVAGCASGEEAFSIAITLMEHLEAAAPDRPTQIFATDIEERALAQARLGVYPQSIERDVSAERLQRFFTRTEKGYQVRRGLRERVVFARHNLGKDPPFSHIDLVSCRNVLIYLQGPLQKKILRTFHYALRPGGFLLLGGSESPGDDPELFSLVDRQTRLYSRRDVATPAVADAPLGARTETADPPARPAEHRPPMSLLQAADHQVLEQYAPPGVVVNERFEALQYRGKTGPYLEPRPGAASLGLLKLVRPELLPALRAALVEAVDKNVRVVSEPVRLKRDDHAVAVRLDVAPLPMPMTRAFVVLFVEEREVSDAPGVAPAPAEPRPSEVQALERELSAARAYLQATIGDLEAANEGLSTSNEELLSTNEELQSTNEELETSKEELQSTNEELITLNEELHHRMTLLDVVSDDLQNILSSTSAAVILVGMDLRIRHFSAAAARLFELISADVGRPIASIRGALMKPDLEQTITTAIDSLSTAEQPVRLAGGEAHTLRVTPYRTADHTVRGAVIELVKPAAG